MAPNPYESQPRRSFWRSGVPAVVPPRIPDIYTPRFTIDRSVRIACAGSCFAQHIGAQFKRRGYDFIDLEPAPPMLPGPDRHKFGYDLYSARYGNVYTPRQLVQMFLRARGELAPQEHAYIDDLGRARDPFRPAIEPDGFANLDELERDRKYHLGRVANLLKKTELFVFTLGLTEAWECSTDGVVLPSCPGTVGGVFDPDKYRFKNFDYAETLHDLETFVAMARDVNPNMKFLFTISPVPLTATATDEHVLTATYYSKSVLRAAVGALYQRHDFVDYFPSYELVASHPMRAVHYMTNLRSVSPDGVAEVMDVFFSAIGDDTVVEMPDEEPAELVATDPDDVICEEMTLDSFGP